MIANTYSTSQIAKIVGLHPNTVRKYEEWGLIPKPQRKTNGYRIYTDVHILQFAMVRKAFQIEVMQAGLRKCIVKAVKLSAAYQFEEAAACMEEYIRVAGQETERAREAAKLCETLFKEPEKEGAGYKRAEAAKELGLTIDTIRNWEMNGLITVKRKENGYRIYNSNDMNRLKIIRSLRCANYSLSAILRMLGRLESSSKQSGEDILELLNTPGEEEDIISVCDRLTDSLEKAIENAYEVMDYIREMKGMLEIK